MADVPSSPAHRPVTWQRESGHQIRLVWGRHREVRVTCLCQLTPDGVPRWSKASPGSDDHWALFNGMPHDPAAGQFHAVDVPREARNT